MISITKTIRYSYFLSSQISFLPLEEIKKQERTRSYKEISTLIKKLPEDWTGRDKTSKKNKKKEKQDLVRCVYGQVKEGESVLAFQVAILEKYPSLNESITQFDTLMTSSAYYKGMVWEKKVKCFIFKQVLPSPLCNKTTIFQIYEDWHFTTLLVEDNQYYFYDSYSKDAKIPAVAIKIHSHLRSWYAKHNDLPTPSLLEKPDPYIIQESCPLQLDNWSCGMHMLLVTLATLYQGKKPVLHYTRDDAMLLSQAHLHHELTGELLEPCMERIVDLLTNPRPENSMRGKSKRGKNQEKVTKNVPPTMPTSQQVDGTSAPGPSTLLGTMVCTSIIVNPVL
jgi:hypothetical protein